jgi:hypothetical protein
LRFERHLNSAIAVIGVRMTRFELFCIPLVAAGYLTQRYTDSAR